MSDKSYSVKLTNWAVHRDEISLIRRQVFIDEQNVPEDMEWDGLDEEAVHVIAINNQNKITGTGRLLHTGQIGRMAVLKDERNKGIGGDMLKLLIKYASDNQIFPLFLHAQLSAVDFYKRYGFKETGGIFDDANIPHCKMIHSSG